MTPENFVYWLQGYFELNDAAGPGISSLMPGKLDFLKPDQLQVIKDHLKLVLEKKTPVRPFSFSYPSYIPAPVNPSSITTDPVYYTNFNFPTPPASC